MTYNVKSLADGQLAATQAILYTCPGGTEAIIKTIILVNTDSVARDVNLYFKADGGTSRRIIPVDMELGIGYSMLFDNELTLEAGDVIEGDATAANVIDFSIHGIEVTP